MAGPGGDRRRDMRRTVAIIERGRRDRLHIGAQVYASLNGAVCADLAIGEARRGVPLSPTA